MNLDYTTLLREIRSIQTRMPKIPYPAGRSGYFLMSDGENIVWSSPSSSSMALDDLTDVNVAGAQDDQTIVYTAGTWLPRNYNLDGLSDVTMGTPSANQALIYTSGAWRNADIPAPQSLSEIGDVFATMSPWDGAVLMWDGTNSRWDAGAIGNTHNLLAHDDVSADTAAQAQIIANSATSGFTWKNVKIEIPGAGTTGLTGGGYFTYVAGTPDKMSLDLAVNFAGSGTASTVARSDHLHSLDNLTDVNVAGAEDDQTIVYTAGTWLPRSYKLDGLADVTMGTPTAGEALIYTSGAWRNATVPAPDSLSKIGDVNANLNPGTGEVLMWDGSQWDAGAIGNSHNLLSHDDVSKNTLAADQIIVNTSGAAYNWRNVGIEIPGAGQTGLTGGYFSYNSGPPERLTLDLAVNFAGSGTASTVARSDHDHSLNDLTDVSINSPTSVQYLGYDGSNWVNSTPPNTNYYLLDVDASDIAGVTFNMQGTADIITDFSHSITTHTDVNFLPGQLNTDDIMKWNGSAWVHVPIPVTNTYTGSAPIDVTGTTISLLYDSLAGALQLIGNKLAVKLGTSADTAAYGDHDHSGVYEPAFTKNSAFNKNFAGSGVATTVARSDHDHSGVYEPAFTKNSAFNKDFAGSGVATTVARSDHTHSNYVNTGGDSMSGALTVSTGTGVYNQIIGEGTFRIRFDSAGGGWARGLEAYSGSTRYMAFGHYGGVSVYNYAYIGKAYNDTSARFYPDGAAQLYYNNSLKLATTSTGATLNGSPIVNEAHRDFDKTWQSLSGIGAVTWNVSSGYNAYMSITGNVTLTVSNLEDGDYGVLFVNCAASSYTITFPTGTKQAGGGGNTVSTSAGISFVDIISFVYRGTTLYITVGNKFS